MAKKLGFFVILSICLLIVEFAHARASPSPAITPEREPPVDSPSSSSSPEEDSSPSPQADSSPSPQVDSSPSPQADSSPSPQEDPSPSPSSSTEAESPLPPASSPAPESLADSPSQAESPSSSYSPSPEPASAPADDDADDEDDTDQETEYFPSPIPSPAPELEHPEDIKASGEEYEEERGDGNGMSGLKKAGIVIGALLGVGAIVIGAIIYKKRRDNMTRARYTYFSEGEFL